MASILYPWVESVGLRHQGVLLSAIRGCDLAPRHDPSKIAQRLLRGAILIPHCGREANPKTYITKEPDPKKWWGMMTPFLESWDHYPNHYVVHFIHAAEVIGYCAPNDHPHHADRWRKFYFAACHKLHLNAETAQQLSDRLNAEEALFESRQKLSLEELHN